MAWNDPAARLLRRASVVAFALLGTAALWMSLGPGATAPGLTPPPAAEPPSTAADRETLLKELDRWQSETLSLQAAGKFDEAIAAAEKMLAVERDVLGDIHVDVAGSLEVLESLYLSKDDVAAARRMLDERIAVIEKLPVTDPWVLEDLRFRQFDLEQLGKRTAQERRELNAMREAVARVLELYGQGKYGEATPLAEDVLGRLKRLYPADRYPNGHPYLSTSLNNLGFLLREIGAHASASDCFRQALEMCQRLYPADRYPAGHPQLAASLNNLGGTFKDQAEYARAADCAQQALEMCQRLYPADRNPEGHPDLAISLSYLGDVLNAQGEYARAADCFQQALELDKRLYPSDRYPQGHRDLAMGLNNVGYTLLLARDFARATDYVQQGFDMCKRLYPADRYPVGHPDLALGLNNLGAVFKDQGEYARAADYLQQALEMNKRLYPVELYPLGHPDLADNLYNLGGALQGQGEYARAVDCAQQALEMNQRLFPTDRYPQGHRDLAGSLNNLGKLLASQGEYARAADFLERGIEMQTGLNEAYLASVGDAQAMTFLNARRESYAVLLSAARHVPGSDAGVYATQWANKGAVARVGTARRKQLAEASDPRAREITEELQGASRQLASLMLAPAETDPTKAEQNAARVKELTDGKETLERQLARQLPEVDKQLQAERRKHADLIAVLPAEMVVVDLLRYRYCEQDPNVPGKKGEHETPSYVAFVLRRDQPVVRVELGPAEPIDAAVAAWRRELAPDGAHDSTSKDESASPVMNPDVQLRTLVWEPLEEVFPVGTSTVALCPDAQLTAIPWSALPGRQAGTVLLEEYALAAVPDGQFLLEQLTAEARRADARDRLLAVGGVNYDDPAQPALEKPEELASEGDRLARRDAAVDATQKVIWPALTGAQKELEDIAQVSNPYTTVSLVEREASEDRVLTELPTVRFAHFATHGFFSPPRFVSMLQDFDKERHAAVERSPLVMSGLVLAGANQPRKKNGLGVTIGNDGILTAEEIVGLDLSRLDLAVLSACETGLGQVAGGEGVFGLQRAFHLAGTKNVVASLWKVDDQATAALMGLFYEKLWKQNKPPIEALREAQLAIYRNPDLIGKLAGERGQSFAKTVDLLDGGRRAEDGKTTHPRLWAAWVLSGI